MANILGSIFVELRANTAEFLNGMSAAGAAAKRAGKDIESSFSGLGRIAQTALAPFGAMGSFISEALGQVGRQAGGAMQSFGKLGGAMGGVAAAGAGVSAAIGAVGLGAIALATHTAESVVELAHQAQAAGVSVEALSSLRYAATQTGVSQESLTKGLEKMSKAAFAAATAPAGATNAFTRLGISVRDASGQILGADAIFASLAGRFAAMPDGVAKTALAIQIFGRGGADMIPILDAGRTGIEGMIGEAQRFGVVINEQTAQAAEAFHQNLLKLQAGGQGFALTLMRDLLPALTSVTNSLLGGATAAGEHAAGTDKAGKSAAAAVSPIQKLADIVAFLAKVTLATGDTLFSVFAQVGLLLEFIGGSVIATFNAVGAGVEAASKLMVFDFSGAKASLKAGYDGLKDEGKNFLDGEKKIWGDYAAFTASLVAPLPKVTPPKPTSMAGVDTGAKPEKADQRLASIMKVIDALRAQAKAELDLAAASSESVAAENMRKAAGAADEIVTRLMSEADRTTGAERAKLIAVIKAETGEIHALTAEKQYAADAIKIDAELNKESLAYDRQIATLERMAAAYEAGGAAVARAGIEDKLEADRQKVAELSEEFQLLSATQGVSAAATAKAAAALDAATAMLERHREQLEAIRSVGYTEEINRETAAFAGAVPYQNALNDAYQQSAEAVRQAQVALQLYNWELAHPGAGAEQIADISAQLDAQSIAARNNQAAQEAAHYSLAALYDDQMSKLELVREKIVESGGDTLLIDDAIFKAQASLIHQWDDAAFAVGTFGDKFTAVMNEIALQGQQAGAAIMKSIVGAIDSVETDLAKLATGESFKKILPDFKKIIPSLAESMMKSEIQSGLGAITAKLGFPNIPGLTKAPKVDGSDTNPFYVVIKKVAGDLLPGATGGGGGTEGGGGSLFGNLEKGIFGKAGGVPENGGGGGEMTPGHGGGGGGLLGMLFGALGKLFTGGGGGGSSSSATPEEMQASGLWGNYQAPFGGGFQLGGDVSPGKAILVGEKRPELFVPRQPGTVIPDLSRLTGGKSSQTSIVNNFNGVKDVDLFRKSQTQIMGQFHRQSAIAYGRS